MCNPRIRQQLICCFIDAYSREQACPPTVREIQAWVGLQHYSTAEYHVAQLAYLGYLTYQPYIARSIQLTDLGHAAAARWQFERLDRKEQSA